MKDSNSLKMIFGPTYCINIKERPERWENALHEISKVNISEVSRFDAIRANPGWGGCRESHLAIFERCRGLNRYTILEDDVAFLGDPLSVLDKVNQQLPDDWDALWLGARLLTPITRFSANLYNLKNAYCTHAIIYNNPAIAEYVLDHRTGMRKIDVFLQTEIQEKFKCFITYPMIATQADFFSDVTNKRTFYSDELVRVYNKNILP